MKFSLIAAVDSKNGIGKAGKLPWHLPSDLAYFHRITEGAGRNIVIMGRTTWESIPEKFRPLKNRVNIILTRNADYKVPPGVSKANSLKEALAFGSKKNSPPIEDIFIIGGAQLFAEAITHPDCEKIYLTTIDGDFECDTFFPKIDPTKFKQISASEQKMENQISYSFLIYQRMEHCE